MPKKYWWLHVAALVVFIAIFASSGFGARVFASGFGATGYGTCGYGSDCPNASAGQTTISPSQTKTGDQIAPQTAVQLPSGLDIAVNLHDGQVIPLSGYTVVVTPLNGHGTSFKQADFYVDGTLVVSQMPENTGTAQWPWRPAKARIAVVEVRVTDQNGAVVTKTFTVNVGIAASVPSALSTSPAAPVSGLPPLVQHIFGILPPAITHAFPYILLGLLAVHFLLLIALTYREMKERRLVQKQLLQLERIRQTKSNFNNLISHYLRTPLTLLSGGVDMLKSERLMPDMLMKLSAGVAQLSAQITGLIETATHKESALQIPENLVMPKHGIRLWLTPSVYGPLVSIGVLVAMFDYVARYAAGFSQSRVTLFTQVLVFIVLATLLYQCMRLFLLKRHDTKQARVLLDSEIHMQRIREQFIQDSVGELRQTLQILQELSATLPIASSTSFLTEGIRRLKTMLSKLTVASKVQGTTTTQPFAGISLSQLIAIARVHAEAALEAKQIQITTVRNLQFKVREPDLLGVVLGTLLDNAAAYSAEKAIVTIDGSVANGRLHITITDQGLGIPKTKQAALFQPFTKVENTETFNHEGMGFSLYLDKAILAYMGGDITLESRESQGTTVRLSLPLPVLSTKHRLFNWQRILKRAPQFLPEEV